MGICPKERQSAGPPGRFRPILPATHLYMRVAHLAGAAIDKIEMAKRLVGYDTTSRNSNLALIEFVRDYLDGHGVKSELVFDESGGKANLYATIGPQDVGGIMLSGHTDVVPIDEQDWHSDPFKLVEKDGSLFGRGSSDMKSFIAVVLTLVPELVTRKLRTPIHLSFSYDEEVGCIGVRRLIGLLAGRPNRPKLCIVGEPTMMQVGVGHKGKHVYRCHVHGHEAHSSLVHQGVNAIEAAAEIVARLKDIARRKRDRRPVRPGFSAALQLDPYGADPWRHRAQHRAQGLRVRFRDPAAARRRRDRLYRRTARVRRHQDPAGDARGAGAHRHRHRRGVGGAGAQHAARRRGDPARARR